MSRPSSDNASRDLDVRFGRAWRDHHRYVQNMAYRALGNVAEAEDVVQEAYARLLRVDIAEIDDVRGWLVVVAGRLCVDRMRAQARRPTSPGELDEDRPSPPLGTGDPHPDPADRVTLDDHVHSALQIVLERLTPAERTTFVLHDAFGFSFEEVATIVGRTPAACRQLASRARREIRAEGAINRFTVEPVQQRQVTERFIAACTTGDMEGLLAVLDPDVAGFAEFGADLPSPPPVEGRDNVALNVLRRFGPDSDATLVALPDQDADGDEAIIVARNPQMLVTITLGIRDGLVHHIHAVIDLL